MVTIMTDQLQVRSEQRQELLVRLPPTYGEAEVPRDADTGAVADQDAGLQEPRAESRGVFHLDEQEIRMRAGEPVAAPGQLRAEKRALLEDEPARAVLVLLVLERRQRGDLAQPVHVVGGADAVEAIDRRGVRHRVTNAQPGEPRDLRERPEHDQAGIAGEQRNTVGGLRGGAGSA